MRDLELFVPSIAVASHAQRSGQCPREFLTCSKGGNTPVDPRYPSSGCCGMCAPMIDTPHRMFSQLMAKCLLQQKIRSTGNRSGVQIHCILGSKDKDTRACQASRVTCRNGERIASGARRRMHCVRTQRTNSRGMEESRYKQTHRVYLLVCFDLARARAIRQEHAACQFQMRRQREEGTWCRYHLQHGDGVLPVSNANHIVAERAIGPVRKAYTGSGHTSESKTLPERTQSAN